MNTIFGSPGMVTTLVLVLIVQALSILLLLLNMHVFRAQSSKYRALFRELGNEAAWGSPGRIILPTYIVVTILAAAVMIYLFVVQPHFL